MNIVRSRLDNLNGPTNRDKLQRPFELLNVPISKDALDAISSRNTFLHAGRLLHPADVAGDPDAWQTTYKTEMHLFTLINKLLLKYSGYEGVVIDWGARAFAPDDPTAYSFV